MPELATASPPTPLLSPLAPVSLPPSPPGEAPSPSPSPPSSDVGDFLLGLVLAAGPGALPNCNPKVLQVRRCGREWTASAAAAAAAAASVRCTGSCLLAQLWGSERTGQLSMLAVAHAAAAVDKQRFVSKAHSLHFVRKASLAAGPRCRERSVRLRQRAAR